MILDMNDQSPLVQEGYSVPDWPFTPLARTLPLREEVILTGSATGGMVLTGTGTPDVKEPPPNTLRRP